MHRNIYLFVTDSNYEKNKKTRGESESISEARARVRIHHDSKPFQDRPALIRIPSVTYWFDRLCCYTYLLFAALRRGSKVACRRRPKLPGTTATEDLRIRNTF